MFVQIKNHLVKTGVELTQNFNSWKNVSVL